jgi:3-oxoadipate enol-lactonase
MTGGIEGTVDSAGLRLGYEEAGSGAGTVVFSHSYLVDRRQFEGQVDALSSSHRVIAFDHRDHGQSDHARGRYGLYDLVADGERVIQELDAAPCHWVGLSTGGFVGMRIALRHPDWFRSLTLMDTSASAEETIPKMRGRAMMVLLRVVGTKPLMGQAMKLMFGDAFLRDDEFRETRDLWRARIAANDRHALIRFGNAVFARDDVLDDLRALEVPVHVIAGDQDRGLPVKHSRKIAETVPDATLSIITGAGHLCTIERPAEVNEVLVPFIESHGSTT